MKKKLSIIAVILVLIAACGFAYYASGNELSYFANYGTNFRRNVNAIAQRFNWSLPQPVQEFLDQTPEPTQEPEFDWASLMTPEPTQEPIEEELLESLQPTKNPALASVPLALDHASSAQYARFGKYILCATETSLTAYNTAGEEQWRMDIQISDPILSTAGNYILLAERGGTKVEVYKKQKRILSTRIDSNIAGGSISTRGDAVLVTEKNSYKGSVIVFNNNGQEVYRWNSGTYSVLSASISSFSRRLAVSLLNTEGGASSKIMFFKLKDSESYQTVDFPNAVVFDLRYDGEILNAISDNKITGLSTGGKVKWEYEYTQKTLNHYAFGDDGSKLCVFDNNNAAEITLITGGGRERSITTSEVLPDLVDIHDGYIAYNNGRDLIFSTLSGKIQSRYMCSRDIQKLYILDSSNVLVVYSSSLEFVKLSKG